MRGKDYTMITKNDCLLLLTEMEERGYDVAEQLQKTVNSKTLPVDVVLFINRHREISLSQFYQKLRKSYNDKKSKLYINIVKDIETPDEVLTTLSALLTQIVLYSKNVEDKEMFLRHARANEISTVLSDYFQTFDLSKSLRLMRIIKTDLKALESSKT